MIETGLFALLSADSNLEQLIGGRVYPVIVPQNSAVPHVCFEQTGREGNDPTVCNVSTSVQKEYEISSRSKSYFEAKEVADAVRVILNNFSGLMGETAVDRVLLQNEQDLFDPEPGLFRVSQTFVIYYQES